MAQDLPTPKFKVGDRVWIAGTNSVEKQLPCPDCLGSKKWSITSPAGAELELACPRCSNTYRSSDIPSLRYREHVGYASAMTIGSIRIDTAPSLSWGDEPVNYMCNETGIGSGSIYRESGLFASEEEAQQKARIDAAALNEKSEVKPNHLEKVRLSNVEFEAAHLKTHNSSLWDAWYSYRALREDVEGVLKDADDGAIGQNEILDAIRERLEVASKYRELPAIGQILELLNTAAETGDVRPLKGVLQRYADLRRDVPAPVQEIA
jgi:hypothetical protein